MDTNLLTIRTIELLRLSLVAEALDVAKRPEELKRVSEAHLEEEDWSLTTPT